MESGIPTSYRSGLAFHLPQCSLKKVHAVVGAYFIIGRPATLQEVVHETEESQDTVCAVQDFLVDIGILRGTNRRKQLRAVGMDLSKAIKSHKGDAAINRVWKKAVGRSGFCIHVLRDARLEGKMDKNRFVYLIFTAAGYRPRDLSHEYTTGTKALISIFRRAGLVRRTNGYFTVSKAVERLAESLQDESKKDDDYVSQDHVLGLEEVQAEGQAGARVSRLLGYCHEINDNYRRGNMLSLRLLCRALLDEMLPILGHPTLESLARHGSEADLREAAGRLLAIRAPRDGQASSAVGMDETAPSPAETECRSDMNLLIGRVVELDAAHRMAGDSVSINAP